MFDPLSKNPNKHILWSQLQKTVIVWALISVRSQPNVPIIIDQPEANLATNYINKGIVEAVKKIKTKKQIILV